ncbi:MAG: glycosyltransferase family 39 protein [Elusimicrobia bacterium]|nr:glycosyltransferase family 39 protein [Elusimicrobiota bacterium]
MSVRRGLAAVFLAALAVRLAVVFRQAPAPLRADALDYHNIAVSMLDQHEFVLPDGSRAARGPAYPAFVASVYAVAGRSTRAVQLAQALLGALACALLAFAAGSLLSPGWGLACGLAAALYRGMADPAAVVLSESLYNLCLAAAFAALAWPAKRKWAAAAAAGAAFAVGTLTRPEALPIAVLIFAGARLWRKDWGAREAGAGLAALLLPVFLWAGRNAVVLGRPVLSSRGGISAYAGLQMPLERMGRPVEKFHMPPAGTGELAQNADYAAAFKRLWAATPLTEKARAYAYDLLSVLYPFLPAYDATYVILLPLWLLGLAAAWRRPAWRPAALFALLSLGAYTAFGGPASRYRDALAPVLVLLAALGGSLCAERAGTRRAAGVGAAWAALNVAVWALAPQVRELALHVRRVLAG